MDHFPRFRRKKDVAIPAIITPSTRADLTSKATPSPSDPQPPSPMRTARKLSPFRVFHRSSGKRARDSPPASLPHSPAAAAVLAPDSATDRPVSPFSLRIDTTGEGESVAGNPQKIPAFLDLTEQQIESKFVELVWLERNRMVQSITNPSPDFRWARVSGHHLKTLDRYMNIQPWHNNRIKLRVPDGHIDYINASPITLTPSPRPATDAPAGEVREPDRYIAMQGPKQASIDHVWRMIVEQLENPGVIVMLTETHDGHTEKCAPYFPRHQGDPPLEINQHDEFGDGFRATVRCEGIEETPAGDAIELRKLVIRVHRRSSGPPARMAENERHRSGSATPEPAQAGETDVDLDVKMKSPLRGPEQPESETASLASSKHNIIASQDAGDQSYEEERIVWHFLYKKWPDFGVPALPDLESFFTLMRLSREKNAGPHNPRVVHCSAGVGRSGTFIALEHLIRELDAGVLEHYDERVATPSPISGHLIDGQEKGASGDGYNASPTTMREEQGEDLIFSTVNQLREQRRTMVQAESQYLFIYQVLRKLWQDKYGGSSNSEEMGERAAKRLEVDPFIAD
ncbi:protein-tyrosine phosphatase-like protein [Lasiosphaeria ovina]|uniref:Protein-tyrosine phosphatase-like protein n=1 Tax=Lasiosphaeria ovina TaxID=92902 RepID=A0AAE0KIE2_9PEZI|nr:protein-tyrosine phosphatase-like protein [Lasiosphaeria ovina]